MDDAAIETVAVTLADYLRNRPLETTEHVLATGGAIEMAKLATEAAYRMGIAAAASYVDGNWSDAHTMAAHLQDVADGKAPMYAE